MRGYALWITFANFCPEIYFTKIYYRYKILKKHGFIGKTRRKLNCA